MALKTEKYRKYYLKCSNTFFADCKILQNVKLWNTIPWARFIVQKMQSKFLQFPGIYTAFDHVHALLKMFKAVKKMQNHSSKFCLTYDQASGFQHCEMT